VSEICPSVKAALSGDGSDHFSLALLPLGNGYSGTLPQSNKEKTVCSSGYRLLHQVGGR